VEGAILGSLKRAQAEHDHLSGSDVRSPAPDIPLGEVFGWRRSTFVHPAAGRNAIRICRSVPCYLRKSEVVIETVAGDRHRAGESTGDGRFSFDLVSCASGPAMPLLRCW
jgi:NADH:ubiquinone oxidoreductase subunit E